MTAAVYEEEEEEEEEEEKEQTDKHHRHHTIWAVAEGNMTCTVKEYWEQSYGLWCEGQRKVKHGLISYPGITIHVLRQILVQFLNLCWNSTFWN